jgi:LmbE family N-acetylglucosaminyl deacetylase
MIVWSRSRVVADDETGKAQARLDLPEGAGAQAAEQGTLPGIPGEAAEAGRRSAQMRAKVTALDCPPKEVERNPAQCRVLSVLLDKLGWHAATGRRLGVVMTVQGHDRPHPDIERTFTAVRAALPAANVAAFDAQLEAITHAPVVDLAALDEFLSGWWRIVTRAAADPADWQRIHQEADQLQSGARPAGRTLAEVLGRRGVHL